MKNKKNIKLRKTLLMMTAMVLVAAVSVGATLAYLTAQTGPVKNEFRSSSTISGKVIEPAFVASNALKYKPNNDVPKDPRIDNDTSGKKIYAGMKLEFFIYEGELASSDPASSTRTAVSYDKFKAFVDLKNLPSLTSSLASSLTSDGDGAWHYVNTDSDGNLYFLYDKQLDPNDLDTGAGANAGGDTSNPIFTHVTVKKEVSLKSTEDGGVTITSGDVNAGTLNKSYNDFRFEIKITGYGVTVDECSTITAARTKLLGSDLMNITALTA